MSKFLLSLLTSLSIVSTAAFAMDGMPEEDQNNPFAKLPLDLQKNLSYSFTGKDIHCLAQTCTQNNRTFKVLITHLEGDAKKLQSFRRFVEIPEGEPLFPKLPCLSSLNLMNNNDFPFDELTRVAHLQCLNLALFPGKGKVNHSDIDTIVSVLTNLTDLNVSGVQNITDISISKLTKLKKLDVSRTDDDNFDFWGTQLQTLNAPDITGECLSGLTDLESLTFGLTKRIDGSHASHLTKLTQLSCIDASINSSHLSLLIKLEDLGISRTGIDNILFLTSLNTLRIQNNSAFDLGGLTNIKKLHLSNNNSNASLDLINLKVLALNNYNPNWADLSLQQFTNLTVLELCGNHVNTSGALSPLTNLTYLNIFNSPIRTNALKLPNLETLIIGSAMPLDIPHDDIYKEWAPFPTLTTLALHWPVMDSSSPMMFPKECHATKKLPEPEPYMLTVADLDCLPRLQKLITHGVELTTDAKDYLSSRNGVHQALPKDTYKFPPLPSLD